MQSAYEYLHMIKTCISNITISIYLAGIILIRHWHSQLIRQSLNRTLNYCGLVYGSTNISPVRYWGGYDIFQIISLLHLCISK